MNRNISLKYIGLILFVLLISACKVTQKYDTPKLSQTQQEALFRDINPQDSLTIAKLNWKEVFTDTKLQNLIDEALAQNYDLKNAVLQIAQAEAAFRQSKLAFFPNLSFNPQVSYNHTSREALNLPASVNIRLNTTTVQLGFGTNWELDLWGKLASAKRGAQATWYQTVAAKNAVQTALIVSLANNYYALLALDQQVAITEQTIELREKTVKTLKALKEASVVTGASVVQAEANLYAAKVSLPDLKQSIRELENSISTMLGKPGQTIDRSTLNACLITTPLATGVPIQMLQNRPDVLAAEMAFRRAFENTNVAKTQFYPTVALTSGGVGLSALTHNNLFAGATAIFANLVGGITQPIFNRGAIKTNYKVAQLQQEQAFNTFQKAILTGGQEVSNALFSFETAKQKQSMRTLQISALEKAVNYNMQLLEYTSNTNYTDVLTSEQSLLAAKLSGVSDVLQQNSAMIELYRALGGGWQ